MEVAVVQDALVVTPDRRTRGQSLRAFLQQKLWLPERFVDQRFSVGAVWIGSQPGHPETVLEPGKRVRLTGEIVEPYGVSPAGPPLEMVPDPFVLYEDAHLLIVGKPAHQLVHPGTEADTGTLDHFVAAHFFRQGVERRVRHVHRLDRDTTGVLLYAKHGYSARALDRLLVSGRVFRTYWALVQGTPAPDSGRIDLAIGRDRHVNGRYRVSHTGRAAVTHYRTLTRATVANGRVALVECQLETGRTHQVRVHLAALGCPVVGDRMYGGGNGVGNFTWGAGHALHARAMTLFHPYQQELVTVSAPLPDTWKRAVAALELSLPEGGDAG